MAKYSQVAWITIIQKNKPEHGLCKLIEHSRFPQNTIYLVHKNNLHTQEKYKDLTLKYHKIHLGAGCKHLATHRSPRTPARKECTRVFIDNALFQWISINTRQMCGWYTLPKRCTFAVATTVWTRPEDPWSQKLYAGIPWACSSVWQLWLIPAWPKKSKDVHWQPTRPGNRGDVLKTEMKK